MSDYKLCYLRAPWAYFTKLSLKKQTGDDWNDAPYDCNAGTPYSDDPDQIKKLAFEVDLQEPADYAYNSPYSVDMINSGLVPWLCDYYGNNHDTKIMAGCLYEDFIKIVLSHGGEIYEKREP